MDDGQEDQYKNAVNILKPLVDNNFKVFAVPGNHDYGFAGNVYTEASQRHFQDHILGNLLSNANARKKNVYLEELYPMVEVVDDVLFLGIDSVVGAENEFAHFASGEVGKKQRANIGTILKNNTGKKVVAYFHHHPFDRQFVMEMDDAKEVMQLLSGKVDVLCFGHDHKSDTWTSKDNIDCILASGKTTDRNKDYKFEYREVTIDDDAFHVATVIFKKD